MKIKHWQGYGSVSAKVVNKSIDEYFETVSIVVSGNHECGIDCHHDYSRVNEWLLEKVAKIKTNSWKIKEVTIEDLTENNEVEKLKYNIKIALGSIWD